jgi:hypothetical protein
MYDTFKVLEILKQTALNNEIIEQYFDTQIHSAHVYSLAKKLAFNINSRKSRNYKYVIDDLVKSMCFSHDAGRMITGSKASKELMPAIFHGYHGANLLKGKFPDWKIARCCETHICGTGLTPETKQENHVKTVFKAKNPSIEEKIVGYADLLTFAKKNDSVYMPYLPYRASLKEAYEKVRSFGEVYAERLDELVDELFFKTTGNSTNGLTLDEIDYKIIPKEDEPKVYDSETKQRADILREDVVNYVKSRKEDSILIKEFTKGDCHGPDGEDNWKLELRPVGLCEHLSNYSYAFVLDGDPVNEDKYDKCVSLDKFEEIVEKYSLNTKK